MAERAQAAEVRGEAVRAECTAAKVFASRRRWLDVVNVVPYEGGRACERHPSCEVVAAPGTRESDGGMASLLVRESGTMGRRASSGATGLFSTRQLGATAWHDRRSGWRRRVQEGGGQLKGR